MFHNYLFSAGMGFYRIQPCLTIISRRDDSLLLKHTTRLHLTYDGNFLEQNEDSRILSEKKLWTANAFFFGLIS